MAIGDAFHIDQKSVERLGLAAVIFALVAVILVFAKSNADGFNILWRYFAWSNQSLSLFAFLAITIWMFENGKAKFAWMPLILMLVCVHHHNIYRQRPDRFHIFLDRRLHHRRCSRCCLSDRHRGTAKKSCVKCPDSVTFLILKDLAQQYAMRCRPKGQQYHKGPDGHEDDAHCRALSGFFWAKAFSGLAGSYQTVILLPVGHRSSAIFFRLVTADMGTTSQSFRKHRRPDLHIHFGGVTFVLSKRRGKS